MPRFEMLKTIREYALERLDASGEADAVRNRHLMFFRDLAEAAEPHLRCSEQLPWLTHLEDEHSNIRAALAWAIQRGAYDDGLRLATAINWFWHLRGHDREGYQWMQRFLAARHLVAPATRARALPVATFFAWILGEQGQARSWCDEGVTLSRVTGDLSSLVHSLVMLGWIEPEAGQRVVWMDEALDVAWKLGDTWWVAVALWFKNEIYAGQDDAQAQALLETSLPLFRQIGNAWCLGWNLGELGQIVYRRGQYNRAAALFKESLAQLTVVGHSAGIAMALYGFGKAAHDQGEHAQAAALLDEGLARFREAGHPGPIADVLCARGTVALAQGDVDRATVLLEESLAFSQTLGKSARSARALHLLGRVALEQGEVARASTLLIESLRQRQGSALQDIPESLEGLAGLAIAVEDFHQSCPSGALRAVRLLGAAASAREVLGVPLPPGDRAAYERNVATVREHLGEATWAAAWAEGWGMTLEQAIAFALETGEPAR
jgi:tetratricopeptide (TPR) repeat protein